MTTNAAHPPPHRLGLPSWLLLAGLLLIILATAWLELRFHLYKRTPFDEAGLVTRLSVLQLATVAFYAAAIYLQRRRATQDPSRVFWLLVALGFAFLAIDEKALVHEEIGDALQHIPGLGSGFFASRMDDLVVGAYGVIALALVWTCRREVLRYPTSIGYGLAGFAGLFLTVALDVLSHESDILGRLISDPEQLSWALVLAAEAEELGKLLGEAFFLAAAHVALIGQGPGAFARGDRWRRALPWLLLLIVAGLAVENWTTYAALWFLPLAPLLAFVLLIGYGLSLRPKQETSQASEGSPAA